MSGLHSYSRDSYPPSGGGRRFGIIVASVVALAVAGYIGSVLGPHFKGSSTPTTTTVTTLAPAATTSTVAHATVKVVVANGTQMANTAAHFTQLLQQQGWNVGSPQNSSTSATTTTIYYAQAKQPSAAIIASEIGAPATALQPLGASTPVANTTGVDVVVVIGADLAGQGFPATTAAG
ncbi:MAG TPA: LytR C-terminal domain-containing protein [Acidimicrobiales bacterium]|nr:LytR C-terminal domain-containing protein [Acidimicrobiales bacterium]